MRRRTPASRLLFLIAVALSAGIFPSHAQAPSSPSKLPARIVLLSPAEGRNLDAMESAFEKRLRDELAAAGREVSLRREKIEKGADRVSALLSTLDPANFDVIVAFGAPLSQAVKQRFGKSKTPLVYAGVSDPISAELVDSLDRPGGNNTGSSDQWPIRQQMELIRNFMGARNRVGCLFDPSNPATRGAMKRVREAAGEMEMKLVERPISSSDEIPAAIAAIKGSVDSIFVPPDSLALGAASKIVQLAHASGIPVFAGDAATFNAGAVAGLAVSYEKLGIETANVVLCIVRDRIPPSQIPVALGKSPVLMTNREIAAKLGLTIPAPIERRLESPVAP